MLSYFKYLIQMTLDIVKNIRRVFALAVFEYKLATKKLFLGNLWKLLNPMIQTGVYWLVFGIGVRSGAPVDGIPYVVWLTCGLTAWFMMNGCVTKAAMSVRGKATMLTKSNIPTCLIPLSTTVSFMLDSLWSVALMFVIYLGNGCRPTWNALGLLYYTFCALAFLAALSLVTSVLVMLAQDFVNLLTAIMRMVFFVSPIFWKPGQVLPDAFRLFDMCNPFGYVIRGFRSSLLYNEPFWQDGRGLLIFWGVTLFFYLLGAAAQRKLRRNLLDFL